MKPNLLILNLSTKERMLLSILKDGGSFKAVALARESKLPRTTVNFLLQELRDKNMAARKRVGQHEEWIIADRMNLKRNWRAVNDYFQHLADGIVKSKLPEEEVEIYEGAACEQVFFDILNSANGERVYFVQGNKSAEEILIRYEKDFFTQFHSLLKRKKVIIEGIGGEKIMGLFKNLSKPELESHLGRLLVSHLAENVFFDFSADLIVVRDNLFIHIPEKKKVIKIKNEPAAKMMTAIINLLSSKTKKADINNYLASLLKSN